MCGMDDNSGNNGSNELSGLSGANNVNNLNGINGTNGDFIQQNTLVGVPVNNMGNGVDGMNNMDTMTNAGINNVNPSEENNKKWPMIIGVVAGLLVLVIIAIVAIKLVIDSNRDVAGDFFDVMVYGPDDEREKHSLSEIKTYFADYSSQENKLFLFNVNNSYDLFKTTDYYDVLDTKYNDFWDKYQNNKSVADLLSEYRKTIFLTEALVGPKLQMDLISKMNNNDIDSAREQYESSFDSMKPQDSELAEIYDLAYDYYGNIVDYYSSFPECLSGGGTSEVCYENAEKYNLYIDLDAMKNNVKVLEDRVVSQGQNIIAEIEK